MAFAPRFIQSTLKGVSWGEAASFGATPGAYAALIKADQIAAEYDRSPIERNVQRTAAMRGPELSLLGPQNGKLSFQLPMRGGALVAGGTAESDISALISNMGMLRANVSAGVGKVTGGTSTTVVMLDADATGYGVGGWVGVDANNGADPQIRPIIRLVSNAGDTTLTIAFPWATDPVAGDDLMPLDYFIPKAGLPTNYLGFDYYAGGDATDRSKIRYLGCAGTWKIPTAGIGTYPMMEFEIMADQWAKSEANRVDAEDLYVESSLMLKDAVYWGATQLDIENFAFDPGLELVWMPGQSGGSDQGRLGAKYKTAVPVFEITPYHDDEIFDIWAAKTTEEVSYVNEESADEFWGICQFKTQVVGITEEDMSNGYLSSKPAFQAVHPHDNEDDAEYPLFSICLSGV